MKKWMMIAGAGLLIIAAIAYAKDRKSFELTEPVNGAKFAEIQFDLAMAETNIRVGDPDILVSFSGDYDADFADPKMEVNRSDEKVYVHIESEGDHSIFGNKGNSDNAVFDVLLSPEPEYALKADIGLGDNKIDLTGLKIRRLNVDVGLADTKLFLKKLNDIEADHVDIESGLGSVDSDHLGYLRFKRLKADVGMGDIVLDLRGFEGEGTVEVSVGMGSAEIIVPNGVGVRVYEDSGFMSSIDIDDMEEVGKGVWESEDFDTAESKLELDLSVGMGDIDVRWK